MIIYWCVAYSTFINLIAHWLLQESAVYAAMESLNLSTVGSLLIITFSALPISTVFEWWSPDAWTIMVGGYISIISLPCFVYLTSTQKDKTIRNLAMCNQHMILIDSLRYLFTSVGSNEVVFLFSVQPICICKYDWPSMLFGIWWSDWWVYGILPDQSWALLRYCLQCCYMLLGRCSTLYVLLDDAVCLL